MKTALWLGVAVLVVASIPSPSGGVQDLTSQVIHFDVPAKDVIAGVASFRASCYVNATGENLRLVDGESARTTIGAQPMGCGMWVYLFGIEIPITTISTTPLGQVSVFIPGLSTVTLGIVDLSLDLQASMNSSTRGENASVLGLAPQNVTWSSWGVERLVATAMHGPGSTAQTTVRTNLTYRLSLGLTISALGYDFYHTDLTDFGSYAGTPSLVTYADVDLTPHAVRLGPATGVTHESATLNWTGTVDGDVNHLEIWLTSGDTNVSFRVPGRDATSFQVFLKPDTAYVCRVVVVDNAGQMGISNTVTFRTAAAPTPPGGGDVVSQANATIFWTMLALAVLAAFVFFLAGSYWARRKD